MMMVREYYKLIICVLVIMVVSLLQITINFKKHRRARQALLPLFAIVYAIFSVIKAYEGHGAITQLFDKYSAMAQAAGVNVELINFLFDSEVAILNTLVVLQFFAVKTISLLIINKFLSGHALLDVLNAGFYAYDEDYGEWFLLHKWINFRTYFGAIVCGSSLATGLYLGMTWFLGKEDLMWNLGFPCAALLVINEIYCFINGQTKEEFEHSVYGDEADARKVSNFYKVREVLEETLEEPLLSAHTGFEYAGKKTAADLVGEWKESEDKIAAITADYFMVDNRYMTADIDCVQAALQLMKRNHVVFFNPFYRDLSLYITLPLVNALLSGKKCIVITGRLSNSQDIKDWLTEVLSKYSHMRSLWRVDVLSDKEPVCEVGILSFAQLYDKEVISVNREFMHETDFVLLIEPSLIVNTGQVALSIIAQEMNLNEESPVYCIIDRNTDGLVDTMSHLLHASITNVVAPPVPRCIYTGMSWDADGDYLRQELFDKQTKYLGNGLELAAIAVKNQIPEVSWYSETKAPIRDIQWIAGQHHSTICRYMNLPAQQKILYEKIKFISNLWNTPSEREKFLIVEDEFCNIFSTMRAYMVRGTAQSFVNVFSENYLLRDYMRCNRQMFMSNPNAIPSIVPDYAKTERNTLIKLLLLMTLRPVTDAEIIDEFHLVGVETNDALDTLTKMLEKYTFANNSIFTIRSVRSETEGFSTMPINQYTIDSHKFYQFFADSLKNAYYILENEKHEEGYIDAKLFNHVTQTILPGQFVTYDGKYYRAKHVSPQSGIVLRRASDLYDGRKYYRQAREYHFYETAEQTIVSIKTIMDMEIAYFQTDFDVKTTGYLEMPDNHNLRLAREIDFSADPSVENYSRKYHNKMVLRIKLPETTEQMRFTICLLLSEIFKSVFPDGHPYLAVAAKRPEEIDGMLNYLVYAVRGKVEDDYIYIIEDSEIDLGLLDAVERNLTRIMEIVTDYIEWHFEKMRESAVDDPIPVPVNYYIKKDEEKKRNLFTRMVQKVGELTGIKKVEEVFISDDMKTSLEKNYGEVAEADIPDENNMTNSEIEIPITAVNSGTGNKSGKNMQYEPAVTEDPELAPVDGTDIFDNEFLLEDDRQLEWELKSISLAPIQKTRYQKDCFLKFGYDEIDGRLQLDDLYKYLRARTWSNNSLTKARRRDVFIKKDIKLEAVNHCDFCGMPLNGVSYEMLNDGRTRCNDCSSTSISTEKEFRKLFFQTLELMEAIYGVRYQVPVTVSMADARKIAKGYGSVYTPSTGMAVRVIGYAQRRWGKYSILIENGAPRLVALDTMVHEMTHIWQYLNWNSKEIEKIYDMKCADCANMAKDIVYEGMAMWASIQYLYQVGETYFAAKQEAIADMREDVYGIGFRLFCERYPLVKDSSLVKYSPFTSYPPLEPEEVRKAIKKQCTKSDCRC